MASDRSTTRSPAASAIRVRFPAPPPRSRNCASAIMGPEGHFRNPDIPIAHGAEVISGRSLVNDRAICPNAAFPNNEIQERVPETETIRTFRLSLNLLGDGFVEALADQTLIDLAEQQCKSSHRKICGQVLQVPIVEAPGQMSRRQVRLERPAREPAVVRRRRLPQRDGHHKPPSTGRGDQALQHCLRSRMTPRDRTAFLTLITSPGLFEPRKRPRVIPSSRAARLR